MKIIYKNNLYESTNRSPNFNKWFGDSITVNSNGDPIIFYHGTPNNVEEVNSLYFWGSENSTYAENYATKILYDDEGKLIENNSNIMPVYFKILNPFEGDVLPNKCDLVDFVTKVYEQSGTFDESFREYLYKLRDLAKENNHNPEEELTNFNYWYETDLYFGDEGAGLIKNMLISRGFDAIHFTEGGHSTYAIFHPNQVKSALGNSGNYSPDEKSIVKE